jgi:large subunit ribosomal protein L18
MTVRTQAALYRFRKLRTRTKVYGTTERPRLSVFRSSKHIYAQIVDDVLGRTLAAASSVDPDVRGSLKNGATVAAARAVGKLIGERAKAAKHERVVFDRGGRAYHGRIKAVAEGAREAGLQF